MKAFALIPLVLFLFLQDGDPVKALDSALGKLLEGGVRFTGRTFRETEGPPMRFKVQYGNEPKGDPYVGAFSGVIRGGDVHLKIDNKDATADIYRHGPETEKRCKRTRGKIEVDTFARHALAFCDLAAIRAALKKGEFKATEREGILHIEGGFPPGALSSLKVPRPRGPRLGAQQLVRIELRARIDKGTGELKRLRLALESKADYSGLFGRRGQVTTTWINYEFTITETGKGVRVRFPEGMFGRGEEY
jgi:hypothetical protein